MPKAKEPANKSKTFSVGTKTALWAKDSAAQWRVLVKLSDKAEGGCSAHPLGLAEPYDLSVSDFRQATSMAVIAALISHGSASQRRVGLVRRFLNTTLSQCA